MRQRDLVKERFQAEGSQWKFSHAQCTNHSLALVLSHLPDLGLWPPCNWCRKVWFDVDQYPQCLLIARVTFGRMVIDEVDALLQFLVR